MKLRARKISAFFNWWGAGLLDCLPWGIHRWFETRQNRLIIAIEQPMATVYLETPGGTEHLGEYKLNQDLALAQILPKTVNLSAQEVVLRLPSKRVLTKLLEFPDAVVDNLRQVLSLDMDRQTPFHKDQVYFDSVLVKRLPEHNKIQIQLVVIPKSKLDPYLERITIWGLQPAVVDVVDNPNINLLPMAQRPAVKNTARWVNGVLAGVVLVLLLAVALLPIWHKHQQALAWVAQVDTLKAQAKEITALRKKLDQAKETATFVVDKKLASPTILALLHELTQKFPDDTWAQQFEVKDREIRVRGESAKASGLISLLENSGLLKNARFLSPVTTNPTTGRERYHIGADMIVKETEAEKADKKNKSKAAKSTKPEHSKPKAAEAEAAE